MKFTEENKIKFLGCYIGSCLIINTVGNKVVDSDYTNIWQCLSKDNDIRLLLKNPKNISKEDTKSFFEIVARWDKETEVAGFDEIYSELQERKLTIADPFINKDFDIARNKAPMPLIDEVYCFLREKGYATPWNGLSIEELEENKWIKII